MTRQEFSDAFDTLLNSYNNQAVFGEGSSKADITLDEYEKSVFLTLALDLIIKLYFERTSLNFGFDDSERRLIDFSSLIRVVELSPIDSSSNNWSSDKKEFLNTINSLTGNGSEYIKYTLNINTGLELENFTAIVKAGGKVINISLSKNTVPSTYFNTHLSASKQGIAFLITNPTADNYLGILATNTPITAKGLVTLVSFTKSDKDTYDDRGILYNVVDNNGVLDILFMLNEKLIVKDSINNINRTYVVKPISYKEYDREMSKAYSLPLKKLAWRLFLNDGLVNIISEVIPIWSTTKIDNAPIYKYRYVGRPNPIILTDLPDGLEIDKKSLATDCELNPILHMDILNKAVELVLSTRAGRSLLALHNTATKPLE